MSIKTRGAPYPLGSDANDAAGWIDQLAAWVNERPGVAALTTTQKNALTGVDRWDGKLVLDITLDRLFRWDAGTTTWIQISDTSEIVALLATTGTPAAAGTASRGVSTSAARADHVHPASAWATYNPTTNCTVGNGSITGEWMPDGNNAEFWARFVMGTTSAMATNPTISLPAAIVSGPAWSSLQCLLFDSGVQTYVAAATATGTTVSCFGQGASNNGSFFAISAASPFTWNAGDTLEIHGRFRRS